MSKNTTTATVIPFPGAPAPMPSNALPAELRDDLDWQVKFLNRVEPVDRDDPNSCRLWQGSRSKSGYGTVRHGRRVLYAHRVAAFLAGADVLPGQVVRHADRCDSKLCCSPRHLTPGTQLDNVADSIRLGRHISVTRTAAVAA